MPPSEMGFVPLEDVRPDGPGCDVQGHEAGWRPFLEGPHRVR